MSNKIKFIANRPWLKKKSNSTPEPTSKNLPEWYRKADRFAMNPMTNEPWEHPQQGKIPTWKACPSIFDAMISGYVYKTPCDLEFYLDDNDEIAVKVLNPQNQDFCGPRDPLPQFVHPMGYHEKHFAWWADWAVAVPEGYSVLYTHPLNRYDLPFQTTNGIIDNDKVNLPGTMPFFIKEGWTGILPAGTPYAQLIPFKREDWESEIVVPDYNTMAKNNQENSMKYRVRDGGVYKNSVWTRRIYG